MAPIFPSAAHIPVGDGVLHRAVCVSTLAWGAWGVCESRHLLPFCHSMGLFTGTNQTWHPTRRAATKG